MNTNDLIIETRVALTANPTRTFLTVLGIVIGIASVIVMLAIGNGAQASVASSISSLGSNVLNVSAGGGGSRRGMVSGGSGNGATTLKLADATAISDTIPLAQYVAPTVSSRSQVIAGANNTNTSVTGAVPAYQSVRAIDLEVGTFITEEQHRSYAKVAVLGPTTRDNLFGAGADPTGQQVSIKTNKYTVIGVTKSKGGSGFGNADDMVYIPLSTAMQYISGGDSVSGISVTAASASDLTPLQDAITALLLQRHKIKDPALADFNIFNQADIAATAASITGIFTILLASVAGISLLVGGIGIMNMMLTTVRERTKEIGLRKAIGAQREDISNQFLLESIVVTSLGGVIGVALGIAISFLVTKLGVATQVTTMSVVLSFGVSALIGVVFGYYPAKKASQLNPIEALRYE